PNENQYIADLQIDVTLTPRQYQTGTRTFHFPLSVTTNTDPTQFPQMDDIIACNLSSNSGSPSGGGVSVLTVYGDAVASEPVSMKPAANCGALEHDGFVPPYETRYWGGSVNCPVGYTPIGGGLYLPNISSLEAAAGSSLGGITVSSVPYPNSTK